MRTTLDIDQELLIAAKELARRQRKTAGQVVSDLLRQALNGHGAPVHERSAPSEQFGFQAFPSRGGVVTNQLIDQLREEVGD